MMEQMLYNPPFGKFSKWHLKDAKIAFSKMDAILKLMRFDKNIN